MMFLALSGANCPCVWFGAQMGAMFIAGMRGQCMQERPIEAEARPDPSHFLFHPRSLCFHLQLTLLPPVAAPGAAGNWEESIFPKCPARQRKYQLEVRGFSGCMPYESKAWTARGKKLAERSNAHLNHGLASCHHPTLNRTHDSGAAAAAPLSFVPERSMRAVALQREATSLNEGTPIIVGHMARELNMKQGRA
eukprot:1154061-Pelagomonas_calceolata.AAC.3